MKKMIVVMMLLLVCGLIIFGKQYAAKENGGNEKGPKQADQPQSQTQTQSRNQSGPKQKVLTLDKGDIYTGELLLVNTTHPVPKKLKVSHVINLFDHQDLMKGFGIMDKSVELPEEMLTRFNALVAAAKADGVTHFLINSGYRDNKKQAELYEQLGSEQANPPGYSEHNLGLSMDIGSTLGAMKSSPEGEWLKENAWKYGFVMRYPEDKTNITGIMYEPWHFRYVGLPHSAVMHKYGFVLEEYLAYLKEQSSIHAEVDGLMYTISYYPIKSKLELTVPSNGSYTIAGDNMDGVIVTTWEDDSSRKEVAG
ncbi:M15 family metallopeptidase [Paenibacillus albus]|uniref:D-alanyl-D-alanine carboxypeptidase family protein n=1 Tax=Paenibacillus albus TaxID=2495582 RepID=A0A3Q8X7Y2_9BACL|nr:M15 family metallopeptidase [Paenibacillus albus]AZN42405.1 D-alanyl-D-alanine carboxypeptidase family protein [Paenibacillus albus]